MCRRSVSGIKIFLLIALIFCVSHFISSCNGSDQNVSPSDGNKKSSEKVSWANGETFKIERDSILLAPFTVEITFSDKAKARFEDKKESIILSAVFVGIPKDPKNPNLAEDGQFYLGSADREIYYGQVATFEGVKLPKKLFDQLNGDEPEYIINVYSGRKTDPDNLINTDLLSGKVSSAANRHMKLHAQLIYGDD